MISVVRSLRVPVELIDFSSRDVRCVAIPASVGEHDIILLNNLRTAEERNFDCAHAMMHLALHSSLKRGNFVCVEGIEETDRDREADEAAGEYCVPLNAILQVLQTVKKRNKRISRSTLPALYDMLEYNFKVPAAVVLKRIEMCRDEIGRIVDSKFVDAVSGKV